MIIHSMTERFVLSVRMSFTLDSELCSESITMLTIHKSYGLQMYVLHQLSDLCGKKSVL